MEDIELQRNAIEKTIQFCEEKLKTVFAPCEHCEFYMKSTERCAKCYQKELKEQEKWLLKLDYWKNKLKEVELNGK